MHDIVETSCHCITLIVSLSLQDGVTPLIAAAIDGHTDTVRELLSSGATVDKTDRVSAWLLVCVPPVVCVYIWYMFMCQLCRSRDRPHASRSGLLTILRSMAKLESFLTSSIDND